MLVVSHNLIDKILIPKNAVIRVNLAWVKDFEEAIQLLSSIKNDIYLDYPSGRTKPPQPTISFDDVIALTGYEKIKYLAISNVNDTKAVLIAKNRLHDGVQLVPKIETLMGVDALLEILGLGIKYIMLDKEDLYLNCGTDNNKYNEAVSRVRKICKDITLLELQGVIFS